MTFYTYAHYTGDGGELFYLGKGRGRRAWHAHNRSSWWQSIVAKHGLRVQILAQWGTEQEAYAHEALLISCFRALGTRLCNLAAGGLGSFSGARHSAETRAVMRKRALSRGPVPPETRAKISAANKGVSRGPHSAETRRRIADGQRGTKRGPLSAEHKDRLREMSAAAAAGRARENGRFVQA